MARHIADHDSDTIAVETQQVIEVTAHRFGGAAASGNVRFRGDHRRRRQQLELQVVGQLQLATDALLAQVELYEPSVLNRRADLIRDGGDQLAVACGERVFSSAVGQIDHPDGRGHAPGRRVHDRH